MPAESSFRDKGGDKSDAPVGRGRQMKRALEELDVDLRWFFGCHQNSPIFERSVTGDMIDRFINFSHNEAGERIRSRAQQDAQVWEQRQRQCNQPLQVLSYDEFATMRGGVDAMGLDPDLSLDADITLQNRTATTRTSEAVYLRHAGISRALTRCTRTQYAALERYFGPMGNRWLRHKLGRLLALYDLTKHGQALLAGRHRRCAKDGVADEGGPQERMADEWRHQRKWKDELRARTFRAAELEARTLLANAKGSYVRGWM